MAMDYSDDATMSLEDLDADYLKQNYLTGLRFYGDDGQPLPKEFFEQHLRRAVGQLQDTIHVDVVRQVRVSEKHDYRIQDYVAFGFVQLWHLPVQSVQEVRAVYPTGQSVMVFPSEWVRLGTAHGQIQLVPTAGTLAQILIGLGGQFLPLIYSGLPYLPRFWEVDYTSGFDPDAIPLSVVQVLAKLACVEILQVMSDLVVPLGVGSQSLGVDGLSQSRSYLVPAFRARLEAYRNDLWGSDRKSGEIEQLRNTYFGYNMAIV